MNNMTEKLIKDGGETRRAQMNLISIGIGTTLLLLGIACLVLKGLSVEYIDGSGVLHENFFLIPVGFLFLFSGFVIFFITGIKNILRLFHRQRNYKNNNPMTCIGICLGIVLLCVGGFLVLLEANSGMHTAIVGAISMICGIASFIFISCKIISVKKHNNTEKYK